MPSSTSWGRMTRVAGNVLAAVVLLAVPVGAIAALQPWQAQGGASAPALADDAVADGLKIVEPPLTTAAAPRTRAASRGESQLETVVRDWTFTGGTGGRPNPSPGH
jgi:hypothetical protein